MRFALCRALAAAGLALAPGPGHATEAQPVVRVYGGSDDELAFGLTPTPGRRLPAGGESYSAPTYYETPIS